MIRGLTVRERLAVKRESKAEALMENIAPELTRPQPSPPVLGRLATP